MFLEHLQRGEVDDTSYGDPYVVLSQHQMQNLGKFYNVAVGNNSKKSKQ